MSRLTFISLIISCLLLAGLVTLRGELLGLIIPSLLYLLYGLGSAPDKIEIGIHRSLSSERVSAQELVTVTVTITNQGRDPAELLVEDRLPAGLSLRSGSPRHLIAVRPEESFTFNYTVAGLRGGYAFESLKALAFDRLGLFQRVQYFPTPGQLFVFPTVTRIKNIAIRPRQTRLYSGSVPARAGGAGIEFFGVRAYQTGDPLRVINWRASARHLVGRNVADRAGDGGSPTYQNLFSNEFHQERVADVGLVLDGRERTNFFGSRSLFEHSVSAVASLADVFINQGNRVGLLLYGSYLSWTLPGYGKQQRERILHDLARAHPGASQVFTGLEHLSPRMFPAESQIVLVSPLVTEDLNVLVQLRARRFQVMVVSPDAVSFERALLPERPEVDLAARVLRLERSLLIRRLKRAGVRVIEWDVAQPFEHAMRRALFRR